MNRHSVFSDSASVATRRPGGDGGPRPGGHFQGAVGGRDPRHGHCPGHPRIQPDWRLASNTGSSPRLAGGMRWRTVPKEDQMEEGRWSAKSRRDLIAAAGAATGSAFLLPTMAKGTPLEWGHAVRLAPAVQATDED